MSLILIGLKRFYQAFTLIIVKFLNSPEYSRKQAIAQQFLYGFPPFQDVTIQEMESGRLGILLSDWGKFDKNYLTKGI
ncbi:MAG: hypothetical protein AB1589_31620 [Cyanobacteriota bacterium]